MHARRSSRPRPKTLTGANRAAIEDITELDLGPSAAYGWLAANAKRFHFLQRYSHLHAELWEGPLSLPPIAVAPRRRSHPRAGQNVPNPHYQGFWAGRVVR